MTQRIFVAVLVSGLFGCSVQPLMRSAIEQKAISEGQAELDRIYMLLAYAIVESEWQGEAAGVAGKARGYNIGSVLVSPEGHPVFWAVNSNDAENNTTQHGEVRLIHQYLKQQHMRNAQGYTVYTTLEPCVMCSGLMAMTKVQRVVHGQIDPEYGGAHARLTEPVPEPKRDEAAGEEWAGPYPRLFEMDASSLPQRRQLEDAYRAAKLKDPGAHVGVWLFTPAAHSAFASARGDFCRFRPSPAAAAVYRQSLALKKDVCSSK